MRNTILATLAVILGVTAFSCFAPKVKDKRQPKLDPSIKIVNLSGEIGLDTITSIGLSELGLKDLKIIIVSLSLEELENNETLMGYIDQADGYYLIKLRSDLYRDYYITILAHELIHLYDMEKGDLKLLYYGFLYKGLVYTFNTPYYDRKFEETAFDGEFELGIKIRYKTTNPSGN